MLFFQNPFGSQMWRHLGSSNCAQKVSRFLELFVFQFLVFEGIMPGSYFVGKSGIYFMEIFATAGNFSGLQGYLVDFSVGAFRGKTQTIVVTF